MSFHLGLWIKSETSLFHNQEKQAVRLEEQLDGECPETGRCRFPDSKILVDEQQRKSLLIIRVGAG